MILTTAFVSLSPYHSLSHYIFFPLRYIKQIAQRAGLPTYCGGTAGTSYACQYHSRTPAIPQQDLVAIYHTLIQEKTQQATMNELDAPHARTLAPLLQQPQSPKAKRALNIGDFESGT